MGGFSTVHWLILLAVIVMVFGTGKLKNLGKDLGGAIKGFKESMKDGDQPAEQNPPAISQQNNQASTPAEQKKENS